MTTAAVAAVYDRRSLFFNRFGAHRAPLQQKNRICHTDSLAADQEQKPYESKRSITARLKPCPDTVRAATLVALSTVAFRSWKQPYRASRATSSLLAPCRIRMTCMADFFTRSEA